VNWLLILGPPIGVLVVVLIVAATGGTRRVRLDAALARQRAVEDIPGFVADDCLIGDDGASALISDRSSPTIAVAYAMGARVAARKISRSDLRSWRAETGCLVLEVDDFAHAEFRIALAGGLTEPWRLRLSTLGPAGGSA
jgi:hypothetical protein